MGKGTSLLDNYKALKTIAEDSGATLFAVADISSVKDKFYIEPKSVLDDLKYGVSIGVRLSNKVLETIVDEPTKIYAFHYKRVNSLLDETTIKISNFIQENGSSALPIPASQVEDWENQYGAVSHKLVAHLAGLGFIGRSGLLVNPKFGSQVRYATVLTDFSLKADNPKDGDCGDCYECVKVCPVSAIKQDVKDLDLKACRELLKGFSRKPGIGHFICGICVKVCKGGSQHGGCETT